MSAKPRVVIIGAGFGGIRAAEGLAGSGAEVLLIDRENHHTFVPLLYQVAVAELEPELVAYPVRGLFRRRSPVRFITAEVKRIDVVGQMVETETSAIPYDFLVVATGSQCQFLGVPGAAEFAWPLKTLPDAIALRNQILHCFEQAAREPNPAQRQPLLTFTIVGGGATGVELAGSLMELIRGPLAQDYPELDVRQAQVVLLQSGDRLLPDLPPRLSTYTSRQLRRMGVQVYLQAKVSQVTAGTVRLEDGSTFLSKTTIWTAGVEAALPATDLEFPTAAKNRVIVEPTLQLPQHPNLYVIGDLAYVEYQGQPLVGVAPAAIQQGVSVARNIRRQLKGKAPQPFSYFNKGRLAIIGRNAGVGKIGKLAFTGFPAWLLWLGVHWVYLPGLRNRLLVLISWLHDYLWRDRAVRLILPGARSGVSLGPVQSAQVEDAQTKQFPIRDNPQQH